MVALNDEMPVGEADSGVLHMLHCFLLAAVGHVPSSFERLDRPFVAAAMPPEAGEEDAAGPTTGQLEFDLEAVDPEVYAELLQGGHLPQAPAVRRAPRCAPRLRPPFAPPVCAPRLLARYCFASQCRVVLNGSRPV